MISRSHMGSYGWELDLAHPFCGRRIFMLFVPKEQKVECGYIPKKVQGGTRWEKEMKKLLKDKRITDMCNFSSTALHSCKPKDVY
jgi:hypothetical protein